VQSGAYGVVQSGAYGVVQSGAYGVVQSGAYGVVQDKERLLCLEGVVWDTVLEGGKRLDD
jgi:hypothetical protein